MDDKLFTKELEDWTVESMYEAMDFEGLHQNQRLRLANKIIEIGEGLRDRFLAESKDDKPASTGGEG